MEQGDGGDPQYRYQIYDLQSGAERFRFEGDSLVPTGNGLFLTSVGGRSGYAGTQNLLASDGSTIRAIPIPSYSSSSYPSKPSTAVPMFLGDGAYDPESGDELWRSSQIVNTATAGTGSAIAAVVGKQSSSRRRRPAQSRVSTSRVADNCGKHPGKTRTGFEAVRLMAITSSSATTPACIRSGLATER
ncbi:hypothetical protein ACETU7_28095 [Rhodococcus sp. 3Y1]